MRAVVAEIALGAVAGLHAIGADERSGGGVMHHEMIADQVEAVAVQTRGVGILQTLSQFTVEDLIAEALAGDQVVHAFGEGETEQGSGFCEALAVLE